MSKYYLMTVDDELVETIQFEMEVGLNFGITQGETITKNSKIDMKSFYRTFL
jgi:hypothetical protein